jgi:hypothetical protein
MGLMIKWLPAATATVYEVEVTKNGVVNVQSTTFQSLGVSAVYNDSVSVRVRGGNSHGYGIWSDPVAVVVPAPPVPDQVTGVTITLN